MSKIVSSEEISSLFKDGMTVMIPGHLACGNPHGLIQLLLDTGTKDMTLISNDTSFPDNGIGRLVANKRLKKVYTTHIGTNPETGRQMMEKELDVVLMPLGTLSERIRAAGAGLGGFLTPTGVGTMVEEGKQKLTIDGKEFLLELPLRANIALLKAWKADKAGNLVYRKAARSHNPTMAFAADTVIVEVENLVEVGEIDPQEVMTPGVLVDKIYYRGAE